MPVEERQCTAGRGDELLSMASHGGAVGDGCVTECVGRAV